MFFTIKGSNKTFSTEQPNENERKSPLVFGPYLKMNKSSKSLIEDHGLKNPNYEEKKPSTPHNAPWNRPPISNKELMNRSNIQEQPKVESLTSMKDLSLIKSSYNTISRSSSLKVLNKDENNNENLEKNERKFNDKNHDKFNDKNNDISKNKNDIYLPNNGNNVIHVTVNNFVNSPTITNTINRFNNRPSKLENTIKEKDEKISADDYPKSKKESNYDHYFNYSKSLYKNDQNKEKTNESSSFMKDYKENKKRVIYI